MAKVGTPSSRRRSHHTFLLGSDVWFAVKVGSKAGTTTIKSEHIKHRAEKITMAGGEFPAIYSWDVSCCPQPTSAAAVAAAGKCQGMAIKR